MLGVRNLYRVLRESRTAAERRATIASGPEPSTAIVAVEGSGPEAEALASLLRAQRDARGAEVVLSVSPGTSGGARVAFSGPAVEKEGEVSLSAVTEKLVEGNLAPKLVGAIDEEYLVPLGLVYPPLRRAVCEQIIRNNARQNAVIGALPIPGADMPAITANQGRMVLGLAAVYGEEVNLDRARELGAVLAMGFGLRAVGRQVVKLVPVAGWAASSVIAYAGTFAMGRAAMLYFERGRVPEGEEREDILRRAMTEARAFVARSRGR